MFWVTGIHLTRLQSCLLQPAALAKCIKTPLPSCCVGLSATAAFWTEAWAGNFCACSATLCWRGVKGEPQDIAQAGEKHHPCPGPVPWALHLEHKDSDERIYTLQGAVALNCSWLTGNRHKSDWTAQNSRNLIVLPGTAVCKVDNIRLDRSSIFLPDLWRAHIMCLCDSYLVIKSPKQDRLSPGTVRMMTKLFSIQ